MRTTKKGEVKFRPGSEILSKKIIRKGKKKEGTIYEVVEAPQRTSKYKITLMGADGKLREVEMTKTQLRAYERELERAAGKDIEAPEEARGKPPTEEKTVLPVGMVERPGEPRLRIPTLYAVKEELERKLGKEAVAKIPSKRLMAYARAVKRFKEDGERRRVEEKKEQGETKKKAKAGKSATIPKLFDNSDTLKLVGLLMAVVIVLGLIAWLASIL